MNKQKGNGFTLIEVLVALVILAIALIAIIKVIAYDAEDQIYLQNKAASHWVAMEVVSEVQLGLISLPLPADQKNTMQMFGHTWYWNVVVDTTPDPDILEITVTVRDKEQGQLYATLIAYVLKTTLPNFTATQSNA